MSFRDWIELESDPGLFTLLVYDFGVQNVEVEEVYDLSKPFERSVYGFIFLFKWTEERKSRRKAVVVEENFVLDESIETDMFFAQQIIPNSCASHALLSVLLNVQGVKLGHTLKQLRDSCKGFDSESKGHAIGNFWNIAVAHNNHGRPELRWHNNSLKNVTASRSMEAFHYVSYIPCKGRLFELDGLKPHPIDHGPWSADESWSDKARRVIQDRIQLATGGEYSHDIRYNLLAVVPEQRQVVKQKMEVLNHNKKVLIELFKKLAYKESFLSTSEASSALKPNLDDHPFLRKTGKKVAFDSSPISPVSSGSSTVSASEIAGHAFSDSEDSCVETYRIKSIMRGKMKGAVFVYGEGDDEDTASSNQKNINNEDANVSRKRNSDQQQKTDIADGKQQDVKKIKLDNDSEKESGNTMNNTSSSMDVKKTDDTHSTVDGLQSPLKISLPSMNNKLNSTSAEEENKIVANNPIKQELSVHVNDCLESKPKLNKKESFKPSDKKEGETEKVIDAEVNVHGNEAVGQPLDSPKTEEDSNGLNKDASTEHASTEQPGLGVEIIADDADISSLLDQNKLENLSLEHLLKYEDKIKLPDLQKCMQGLDEMYKACESSYKEELDKIEKYKIDDCRRRHNYDPFISTFLSMLADQGHLAKLLEQQNTVLKRVSNAWVKGSNGVKKEATKKKTIKKKAVKKK
ncbi:ubiquitin carboxyl-terminal hydrolase BAP1-like [Hydractinia symbiolongicarpus]|uniref:ubiquitin carboxyl-terminal hydrolase BAP1-like n=1 Tax=Hydractinia symbiolongicarpus TaxID=13093 RepID=UPI0025511BF3|nr:ubiquitin carboxyl-terminal hydrolase BAP1-like [Hydractinia symbiolongicarpus]